jgi:proteasome lid subunit RPN8/RPN11
MILNSNQLNQLISQARRDAPNETWGMIGGKDGRALKIFPMTNTHTTPQTRYVADSLELLRVVREIEDVNGWDILAIYHSHPKTEPYPSATDTGEAHYPDSIYIIISLQNPDQAKMRGYRIVEGKVSEITIEIEDEDESSRAHPRRAPRRANRPRPRRVVAALSKRRPARRNTRRPRRRLAK